MNLSLTNLRETWYSTSSLGLGWLLGIPLMILWGLMAAFLPWYLVILVSILGALSVLFLVNFKISLYFLLCLLPIAADSIGIHFKAPWNNPLTDIIPLYLPISLIAVAGLFFNKAARLQTYSVKNPFNKLFFILFCWAVLLILWVPNLSIKAIDSSHGMQGRVITISHKTTPLQHNLFQLFILANNILLFYLIINSIEKESFHRRIMWWWIMVGIFVAMFTFFVAYIDPAPNFIKIIKIWYNTSLKIYLTPGPFRGSYFASPHLTALILNMFSGITFGMALAEKKKSRKVILGVITTFMMLSNLLTLTKGGLVGLLVMLHFFLLSFSSLRKNFFRNLILLYSILLVIFILQVRISKEYKLQRTPRFLYTRGYIGAGSTRAKIIWIPGFKYFIRTGGTGLGVGTFSYATISPHAHSIYLSVLYDFGVVGVIIFAITVLILAKNYINMIRFQQTYLQIMFLACCGVLLAIGAHGFIDFEYNYPVIWLFMGLYTATFLLAQRELLALKKSLS